MRTEVIRVDPRDPDPKLVERAAEIIRRGGIVAFPTETVYGLGADGRNERAVLRIFELKGRPPGRPLILHLSEEEEAKSIWEEVPDEAYSLMKKFWPGPLTIVLKKRKDIPDVTSGGTDTIGARIPDHPVAISLISLAETPVAAPSANPTGKPSPTRASEVLEYFLGKIEAVLDGGETMLGIESTVIDLTSRPPKVLRKGAISIEEIMEALRPHGISKLRIERRGKRYEISPKVIAAIYSDPEEILEKIRGRIFLVRFNGEIPKGIDGKSFFGDIEGMAKEFFQILLKCDKERYDYLILEVPPEKGIGEAIRERIMELADEVQRLSKGIKMAKVDKKT